MKHILLILSIALMAMISVPLQAQINQRKGYNQRNKAKETEKRDTTNNSTFKDHLTFGGNAWAVFGNVTQVELMPLVGYKVNKDLQVGLGPSYVYRNVMTIVDNTQGPPPIVGGIYHSANIWGGRVYVHYNFISSFFVRGELEELSIPYAKVYAWDKGNYLYTTSRRFVPATLVGGGIKNQIGEHSFAYVMFMYDLTYDQIYSYYGSPYRMAVGFMF